MERKWLLLLPFGLLLWLISANQYLSPVLRRQYGETIMVNTKGNITRAPSSILHKPISRILDKTGNVTLNYQRKSYHLWKEDGPSSPCFKYHTRFGEKMTKVLLLSFPGSGNTWTRYLLEGATGIFTGNIRESKILIETGFLGDADPPEKQTTLVQKSHRLKHRNDERAAIIILRNPFNVLITLFKFKNVENRKDRKVGQIPLKLFKTKEFHNHVQKVLPKWEALYSHRLLMAPSPTYVLYYENLVNNTIEEVVQLLSFLKIPVDEGRLACLKTHLEGPHKRKNSKKIDPYTKQEKQLMLNASDRLRRLLVALGYPEPPPYPELE